MTERERWIEQQVPALAGKTALVTGANSGLGLEAAKLLAAKGARVILAVRDPAKGEGAAMAIRRMALAADLAVLKLDLAQLASVRAAAAKVLRTCNRLDILMNNAGVMAIPRRTTADGFETQLGVNHLGHFALTGLLLPLLLRTPDARVVTVSSSVHVFGRINFDDLHGERRYRPWLAYAQSKLANLLFAYALQRRLAAAGRPVISVAAHPGYAATNLQRVGPEMSGSRLGAWLMAVSNRLLAQSAEMGALPQVYAAVSPDVRGGDYIGPGRLLGQRGFPKKVRSSARSYDVATADRLWTLSEQLTGVRFEGI